MRANESEKQEADDALLSALQRELESIESAEFIRGLDKDELERKGFIGSGRIEVSRNSNGNTDNRSGLQFEPGIVYERLPDDTDILQQDLESLSRIPDIRAGTLIAKQREGEKSSTKCGQNVHHELKDGADFFIAGSNGKVLLIKDTIHVFPGRS